MNHGETCTLAASGQAALKCHPVCDVRTTLQDLYCYFSHFTGVQAQKH